MNEQHSITNTIKNYFYKKICGVLVLALLPVVLLHFYQRTWHWFLVTLTVPVCSCWYCNNSTLIQLALVALPLSWCWHWDYCTFTIGSTDCSGTADTLYVLLSRAVQQLPSATAKWVFRFGARVPFSVFQDQSYGLWGALWSDGPG